MSKSLSNNSLHFAALLRRSYLPQKIKDKIVQKLPTLAPAGLAAIYAFLEEEDHRKQKLSLQWQVEGDRAISELDAALKQL